MLTVISPAKKLDMTPADHLNPTTPRFTTEARKLVDVAAKLDANDLMRLMKISENLANINADRFARFTDLPEKPAVLSFAGDTYLGLEASSLESDELTWAQSHLRILSGLYGILRPLDKIKPYRLEMGSRLKTERGKSLYDFWGDQISQAINQEAKAQNTDVLINCASQEYFRAVNQRTLMLRVITPMFYEDKNGQNKIVSFYAKRARGAMARFIIQHRLTDPDSIKDFDLGGYKYRADLSTDDMPAFVRAKAA